MTGKQSKNFHGVGIGPLSKILTVKYLLTYYGNQKFPLSFTNQNQKGVNIEKLYF